MVSLYVDWVIFDNAYYQRLVGKVSKKELKLFLGIWGISPDCSVCKMFAPALGYQGNYGNMGLWGVCDWNDYGSFYYFSGFIGYLLLAYYLTKYPLKWSWKKLLSITIPMFLTGYLITSYGYVITQNYFPEIMLIWKLYGTFCRYQRIYDDLPGFVIVQKIKVPSNHRLSHMASLRFGVYGGHFVFFFIFYDLLVTELVPFICPFYVCGLCRMFSLSCYFFVWYIPKT